MQRVISRALGARAAILKVATISAVTLGIFVTAGGTSSAAAAASPGVTKDSIAIGVIEDETGAVASQEIRDYGTALSAVVDSINAHGGIYGRKINLIVQDDQTSPQANLAAAQSLIQTRHVFGIVDLGLDFGSAQYVQSQGVPQFVIGDSAVPGSLSTYTDRFSATGGTDSNPNHVATNLGHILKSLGAKKVGGITYSVPTTKQALQEGLDSAQSAGLGLGYTNTSFLPGAVSDWAPIANEVKSGGNTGDWSNLTLGDSVSYYTALEQTGAKVVKLAPALYGNGYLQGASKAALQGVYSLAWFQPSQIPSAATKTETKLLRQYGHLNGDPDFFWTGGYVVGLLLQEGLQVAGPNPTQAGLVSKLRNVTSWNAGGLAAKPVNFKTANANPTEPYEGPGNCSWVVKASGSNFIPVSKTPFCGPVITKNS